MPLSDLELFARLIKCEAGGEGDNGMKGVANVVMNRVNVPGGEYYRTGQGNLRNVILQDYQFTCAMEYVAGQYNPQNIYNMRPEEIHYEIARWAIAGNKLPNLGISLWYFNPFAPTCPTFFPSEVGVYNSRIVDHCYYDPTPAYYKT